MKKSQQLAVDTRPWRDPSNNKPFVRIKNVTKKFGDVLAVHDVTRRAAAHIRAGNGPVLIEALTYRTGPHTSSDDPTRYRDQAEADAWIARDPLTRVEKLLDRQGWWDPGLRESLDAECDRLGVELRSAVKAFGPVELGDLFDTVLGTRSDLLNAQKADYADFVAGFEEVPS